MSSEVQSSAIAAKGQYASIEFDGRAVTVKHSRLSGSGRGERTIPVSQISGVDLRPATLMTPGAFTLVLPGAVERRKFRGGRDEWKNENTVQFNGRKASARFEELRDAILAAL